MILNFKFVLAGNGYLLFFDCIIMELDYFPAFNAYHMIVVMAVGQFKNRAFAEMMPQYQPGSFELCQYAVDGCQANIFLVIEHDLVHVLSREVTIPG